MTAADRPSPRNGAHGRAGRPGARGANTNGARTSGPVVPARREQRIERSPATVIRQAGEVRGRARPGPGSAPDNWSSVPDHAVPDHAVPMGPGSADLSSDIDARAVDDRGPATLPVPFGPSFRSLGGGAATAVGDITYDRAAPVVDDSPDLAPTGLVEHPLVGPAPELVPEPASTSSPMPAPGPRRSMFQRRSRVRRVSRVIRRVDAWSVLKISAIFYALAYLVVLVAGVLLWNLALTTGTVANVEGFVRELFGLRTFRIDGQRLYRASWPIGVFLAVAGTGLNVTAAVMFNLVTDLVGGVRVTVLEEEIRVVEPGGRRRLLRRPSRQAG